MAQKPVISVVGSLNIDFVTLTPRVPGPGQTLTATSLQVNAGGKGANQAVACGKASFTSRTSQDVVVGMIGAVGIDDPYYASLLKPTLQSSGVSTLGIKEIHNSQTGTATILVEEDGQNRILVVPGANFDGMSDFVPVLAEATANGEPDVLVMQGEIPRSTTLQVLNHFSKAGSKVIFNPAPVFPEGVPIDALKDVDFLIVNESECLLLAKDIVDDHLAGISEADLTLDHLTSIARALHQSAAVKHLLVTLGANGVLYSSRDEQLVVPGIKVDKVVDTTAAGDTFVGYFAATLARHISGSKVLSGFDVSAAVSKANTAAAICVQRSGAMQSIPFAYELD